jgi:glycine/D-amino acid oxidase-like deaminating enzyme
MVGGYNGRGIAPGAYWGRVLADWATGMPRPELPVPVVEPPAIAGRWLKQQFFANSWRAWRLWEQIEGRLRRY